MLGDGGSPSGDGGVTDAEGAGSGSVPSWRTPEAQPNVTAASAATHAAEKPRISCLLRMPLPSTNATVHSAVRPKLAAPKGPSNSPASERTANTKSGRAQSPL